MTVIASMAYGVGGVAAMAYGVSRVDGVWRVSRTETSDPPEARWWHSRPDLAMPNSARHCRDNFPNTTRRCTKSRPSPPRQRWGANATANARCGWRRRRLSKEPRGAPRQGRGAGARVDVRKKKARTPRCGQIQLRPRLEEAERVVHDDVRGGHPDKRRDGGDLSRREHRRRGRSGAEPGGVVGRHAHGARLVERCPGPVPHDCFALLRARLPSHPAALRRWRAACVECASMASPRSVAMPRARAERILFRCLGSLVIGPPPVIR